MMGLRVKSGALLVGVVVIVVLTLTLFLVPEIMAQEDAVENVGNVAPDETKCWMIDPETIQATLVDPSPELLPSRVQEYPDMNAVMKCGTQIVGYDGPADQFSAGDFGSGLVVNCIVKSGDYVNTTTKWHQSVSSDGKIEMRCHFRR